MDIVNDKFGNRITLTDERWQHIISGHPELEPHKENVLQAVRVGKRKQDLFDLFKYKYYHPFSGLPFGFTHIIVVVKLIRNNFIITAYGIRREQL